jgi:UPF0755 protein
MKKLVWGVVVVIVLAGLGLAGYSTYSFTSPASYHETKTVVIPAGSGAQALLKQLHKEGLLPRFELVALPVFLTADYKKLKAGEYEFAAGMSPKQIIEKIIRGEVVVHKVTIPEGWTSYQVRSALMAEPLLTGELPDSIPEGSILPDTMHYSRGELRSNVLKRMQDTQAKLLAELWGKRAPDLPYATPQEALIMASIVERETGEVDERAMVAGVFVNRLRKGMMLQTDPSVIYGIEQRQGGKPMDRLLSRADLQRDTPFNTYTRTGLTPTPIGNPGRKAIEAALNPAFTDALYFVATGTGGHRFASTLKGHEANVAHYRKVMRAQAANPSSASNSPN